LFVKALLFLKEHYFAGMSAATAIYSSVTSGFDDAYENGAMAAKKLTGEPKYWDRIKRISVGLILCY
jgi:hypothetical protein